MSTTSGSSTPSSSGTGGMSAEAKRKFVMPTPAYMAPAGASLGQSSSSPGQSLVSSGRGSAVNTTTGVETGTLTGKAFTRGPTARSLITSNPGGGAATGPTVAPKPTAPVTPEAPAAPILPTPARPTEEAPLAPVDSTVVNGPARNPAQSNNFLSIVGGAGGLGRRSTNSKRTLIGGA